MSWPFLSYTAWLENFRVDFEIDGFIALIEQKGYRATWSKWAPCPCVREESAQSRVNCPLCHGRGDRFISPVELKVLMTSLGAQKEFQQYSQMLVGTAALTLYSEDVYLGYRDQFQLSDSMSTHSEFRQRSSNPNVVTEFLQYAAVEISLLCTISVDGNSYVDLVQDTDFTLNANGSITWMSSAAPAPRSWYTVVYLYHPTYMVIDILNDVRDTMVKDEQSGVETFRRLPQRAMARRSHLLFQSQEKG